MRLAAIILLLLLSGCYKPQSGSNSPETRTELDELADQNLPMGEKYLELGKVISTLMDETASIGQDAAASAHMEEFLSDNESALRRLGIQLDNWQKNLTEEDRLFFVMELLSQPYSTRLKGLTNGLRGRFSGKEPASTNLRRLTRILEFRR